MLAGNSRSYLTEEDFDTLLQVRSLFDAVYTQISNAFNLPANGPTLPEMIQGLDQLA